jgi:hypothetical protein
VEATLEAPPEPVKVEPEPAVKAKETSAEDAGLRPRLKLTPTATDEEFASLFEAAGGRTPEESAESEGWTWRELLSSIDDEGGVEGDHAQLEANLIREVVKLGIDPSDLLARDRVEEVAAAVQTGDVDGAREVVRKLIPAAIRRVVRSLANDEASARQVAKQLGVYRAMLTDAAARDPEGFLVSTLLGSDAGCAYLVLDAAAGRSRQLAFQTSDPA